MNIKVSEYAFSQYSAIDDDSYDGAPDSGPFCSAIGIGKTPYSAVQDLRENYELIEHDDGIMACDIWLMANREMA